MPSATPKDEDFARELRIAEGVEVMQAAPRILYGMFFAFFILIAHEGFGIFHGWVLAPLALILLLIGLAMRNYFKLRNRPRPSNISIRRIRSFLVFSAIMGVAWGAMLGIILVQERNEAKIVALSLAFIGTFGTTNINSIRISLGFGATTLSMVWVAVIWSGLLPPLGGSILFSLAILTIGYFSVQAHKGRVELIMLGLRSAKAMQAQFEADEKLRIAQIEVAEAERVRQSDISRAQRDLINAIPYPLILMNGDAMLEITPQAQHTFGLTGDGGRFRLAKHIVDAEAAGALETMMASSGQVDDYELEMCTADGRSFWVTTSMRALQYQGQSCWLIAIYVIDARRRMEQDLAQAKERAETALADLRRTQDQLIHAEKMAGLGQLTAGIAHEIKNPLNFVINFSKLSADMIDELSELLAGPIATLAEDDRADAQELMDTVRQNIAKIDEHGARADSIVKNMLAHSRESSSERQVVALNALAEEALNLAYHGARAADATMRVDVSSDWAADVGEVEIATQEVQRVFMNLCTNGIYAAQQHAIETGQPAKLHMASRVDGDNYVISVADNGAGIPEAIRPKVFDPFFTTKPTGEGTGLGLSLSFDIISQHSGAMDFETAHGAGTTFFVRLPRRNH